jgi:hypothetical protein
MHKSCSAVTLFHCASQYVIFFIKSAFSTARGNHTSYLSIYLSIYLSTKYLYLYLYMVRFKLVLVLLFIVIAGTLTTQSYREPSWNTARRCRTMPKASHPSDLLSANQFGKNGYLVWGRGVGPSGGVGNDFVFWPAVFSASLLSGRTPVLDDITSPIFKLATICNSSSAYLACSVPLLSSVLTDERREIGLKMVRVDVKEVLRMPDTRFLRVDGFFRHSNWWQSNRTLSRCVRNVLNCSESGSTVQKAGRHLCVERS